MSPPPPSHLLVFDGECGLCTRSVQWVLRHDRRELYRFASVQSQTGGEVYRLAGLDPDRMSSLVVVVEGRVFTRSEAVLRLLSSLGGAWSLARFALWVPRPLRDALYDWVARRRRRLFAGSRACLVAPGFSRRLLP